MLILGRDFGSWKFLSTHLSLPLCGVTGRGSMGSHPTWPPWFGIGKLRVFDLKRLKIFSLHYVSYFSVSFCIFLSLVALEKKQTGASFGWSLCTSSPCWEAGKGDVEVRVVSAVKGLVRVVLCCAEGPRVGLGTWRLLLSGWNRGVGTSWFYSGAKPVRRSESTIRSQ